MVRQTYVSEVPGVVLTAIHVAVFVPIVHAVHVVHARDLVPRHAHLVLAVRRLPLWQRKVAKRKLLHGSLYLRRFRIFDGNLDTRLNGKVLITGHDVRNYVNII